MVLMYYVEPSKIRRRLYKYYVPIYLYEHLKLNKLKVSLTFILS